MNPKTAIESAVVFCPHLYPLHSGVRDIESFISCVKQSTNIEPDCPFHVLHYVHGMRNAFPIDSLHCLDLGMLKYNLRDLRKYITRKVALLASSCHIP